MDLSGYEFYSPSRVLLHMVIFSEIRAGYAIKWFAEYGWPLIVYSGKVHYIQQVCSSETKCLLIRVGVGLPSPRSQVFGRPGKVFINKGDPSKVWLKVKEQSYPSILVTPRLGGCGSVKRECNR